MRLELARVFFLKGQDGLARRHFELVLAGGMPPLVADNIRRFLNAMQTRKRFTGYFGAAFAPDSNLNAASESEIIYIDTAFGRLPFQREGDFGARSGLGVSVWGGGEYQHPLSERLRLRVGADTGAARIQRQRLRPVVRSRPRRAALAGEPDYRNQPAGHRAAPMARRRPIYADETGVRLELDRRLTPRLWARGTAAYRRARPPIRDMISTARRSVSPPPSRGRRRRCCASTVTVGYERDHAASEHWRNLARSLRVGTSLALPFGFTLGTSAQIRRTYCASDGSGPTALYAERQASGSTASARSACRCSTAPSPCSASARSWRSSTRRALTNAQAQDYDRNRAELRFVRQF